MYFKKDVSGKNISFFIYFLFFADFRHIQNTFIGVEYMHLNELMKIQRKSEKLSQAKFYEGIFQRNSASLFENHNEHFLKIADLPLLADRSNLTIPEIIRTCNEDFKSVFDKDLETYYFILSKIQQNPDSEYNHELYSLYQKSIHEKFTSLKYMNLYLLIKLQTSSLISEIIPVDKQDLADIKKMFSSSKRFVLYHYKILSNLCTIFPYSDLQTLIEQLFPLREDSDEQIKDTACLSLSNAIALSIFTKDYSSCFILLNHFETLLSNYTSYKYKLSFIASRNMLLYFTSGDIEHIMKVFSYVEILKQVESPEYVEQFHKNLQTIISKSDDEKAKQIFGVLDDDGQVLDPKNFDHKKID